MSPPTIQERLNESFDENVLELLAEFVYITDLREVDRKAIHESVTLPKSWTDGSYLVFLQDPDRFLYYIGAEGSKHEIEFKYRNLWVVSIDEERMDRLQVLEQS